MLRLTGDHAILSINCGCNISLVESVSGDREVLTSCGVSGIGAGLKDHGNSTCLVAGRVVVTAVGGLLSENVGLSSLPLHGDVVRFSNWELSNHSSYRVSVVLRKGSRIINNELKVD